MFTCRSHHGLAEMGLAQGPPLGLQVGGAENSSHSLTKSTQAF